MGWMEPTRRSESALGRFYAPQVTPVRIAIDSW